MKKIFKITTIFLVLLILIVPNKVKAESTYIKNMNITTTIKTNGDAHIKEIWMMSVNEGSEVYKVMNNMNGKEIKNLKVHDEKGEEYTNIGEWDVDADDKDYKCGLVTKSNGYELCFGIGDYGNRTYTFEYDVTNLVEQFDGSQGFNFAFFSDLNIPIDNASITINYPSYSFTEDNSKIYAYGYDGYVIFKNGYVEMGLNEPLDSNNNKMQVLMKIEDGTFSNLTKTNRTFDDILEEANKDSEYEDDTWIIIVVIIIAIVLFLIIFGVMYIYTRNTKDKEVFEDGSLIDDLDGANMFRDIPCDNDLYLFYYLANTLGYIKENQKGGIIAAIILKWVRDGYITFEKTKKRGLIFKKEGFTIEFNKNIQCHNDNEKKLLKMFKKAAGSNGILETGEFENWCEENYERVDDWFEDLDSNVIDKLYDSKDLTDRVGYRKQFGIKFKCDEIVYSNKLKEYIYQIVGFKKFIEEMTLLDEKEVIEVRLWEDYLIYASILGLADKVEKQLGKLYPEFSEESNIDIYYTSVMIRDFSNRGYHSAFKAHYDGSGGSSSFSGGGGSFSGGGGGGVR